MFLIVYGKIKMTMKIAIINNLYPPFNRGGAESVVKQQVNDLTQQGHVVFVITTKPLFNFQQLKTDKSLDYKIYRFYPANIFSFYNLNKLFLILRVFWRLIDIFNLHSYFKIKKILTQEKPDVVYTHNLTGLGYLIPHLIKKLSREFILSDSEGSREEQDNPYIKNNKIKHIHTIHDVALIRPSGLLISGQETESILIKLYFKLTRWLFNSPDEVIFPSTWIKDYYTQHNFFANSKKQVIKNFNVEIKNLLSNKTLKTPTKVNLLYIGQIEKHKGILFMVKAINKLQITNYKLQVIGDGTLFKRVKQLASKNQHIKFYGQQSNQQIKEILKQTDYLVVPSLCYENSPTVIFEALELGVPVIASNLGGIPELIKDKMNGYLFKANDKNNLIKILKKL